MSQNKLFKDPPSGKSTLMESSVPFAGRGSSFVRKKIPTLHHPEGTDPEAMFFQEARIHELIVSYQRQASVDISKISHTVTISEA